MSRGRGQGSRVEVEMENWMVGRMLEGELSQPRVAGLDKGDSFPEPVALCFGEVAEKGEQVELVVGAEVRPRKIAPRRGIGLVEEDDFRDDRGQTPRGLL